MDGGPTQIPGDRILCEGKFYRLVAACFQNCPLDNYCPVFWDFFKRRGITPVQYLRQHGLGEDAMKRIVFDCDRCGKKDIGQPFSVYYTDGEREGERISDEEFQAQMGRIKSIACSTEFLGSVLDLMHREEGWEHYCDSCMAKIATLSGALLGKTAKDVLRPASAEAGMSVAGRALANKSRAKVVPLDLDGNGGDPDNDPDDVFDPPPKPRGRPKSSGTSK